MPSNVLVAYAVLVGMGCAAIALVFAFRAGRISLRIAFIVAWLSSAGFLWLVAWTLSGGRTDLYNTICFPALGATLVSIGMMLPLAMFGRR